MSDALDKEIADKRDEAEGIRQRLKELDREIAILERAAALRPPPASSSDPKGRVALVTTDYFEAVRSASKGRQRGAISKDWRRTLEDMNWFPPLNYYEIMSIAKGHGVNASLGSIRDRVRHFIDLGYLEGDVTRGFKVTDAAKTRFSFPEKNEAPDAVAPGPHKSELQTDHTGNAEPPEKGVDFYE